MYGLRATRHAARERQQHHRLRRVRVDRLVVARLGRRHDRRPHPRRRRHRRVALRTLVRRRRASPTTATSSSRRTAPTRTATGTPRMAAALLRHGRRERGRARWHLQRRTGRVTIANGNLHAVRIAADGRSSPPAPTADAGGPRRTAGAMVGASGRTASRSLGRRQQHRPGLRLQGANVIVGGSANLAGRAAFGLVRITATGGSIPRSAPSAPTGRSQRRSAHPPSTPTSPAWPSPATCSPSPGARPTARPCHGRGPLLRRRLPAARARRRDDRRHRPRARYARSARHAGHAATPVRRPAARRRPRRRTPRPSRRRPRSGSASCRR